MELTRGFVVIINSLLVALRLFSVCPVGGAVTLRVTGTLGHARLPLNSRKPSSC